MKNHIFKILTLLMLTHFLALAQLTVKDQESSPNTLLQVNDEGTAGSLTLPPLSSIGTSANKLYNIGSSLFWNGSALGTVSSAGGWTDDGAIVRLSAPTDKIGIGTASPYAALHVTGNDGVIFEGEFGSTSYFLVGSGAKMLWYPKKAAFRAGYVETNEWNDGNLGIYSTALGYTTVANGFSSTSIGYQNFASGSYSTAFGFRTNAFSYNSTAIGFNNVGSGTADSWVDTDPLFEIGNGYPTTANNAMTVLKNGNVGIGPASPSAALHVTGNDGVLFTGTSGSGTIPAQGEGTRMMWYPKKAAFRAGTVAFYPPGITNYWDDANIGESSTAFGTNTIASGDNSTALGSFSMASGNNSMASGVFSIASGISSTAIGDYTTAASYRSMVIGCYNLGGGSATSWIGTDPLFEIGNGQITRNNALTVLKNGNIGIGLHNPSYKLDISSGNLLVRGTDGFTATGHEGIVHLGSVHSYIKAEYGFGVKIGAYAAPDAISIKESSGDVGIGTTSPSRKLYVNGDAGGTGGWHNDSDRRLKRNIETIPRALDKVNRLSGVNFEWKNTENHSKGVKMGFIAQEAKEVIPEVVSKSGEYYSMQYASITALLVEAVKEQNKEFRTENVELKKRVEQLEKIVSELVNNRNNTKLTSVWK